MPFQIGWIAQAFLGLRRQHGKLSRRLGVGFTVLHTRHKQKGYGLFVASGHLAERARGDMVPDMSVGPSRNARKTPSAWPQVRLGDAPWLLAYSLQAIVRLARARLRFVRFDVSAVQARNKELAELGNGATAGNSPLPDRIAFVIPRVARFMPWRADCLIQADAAQRWLASNGYASRIIIGVEGVGQTSTKLPFGAHAWLEHDGRIVTGGDVSRYTVLL